MFRKYMLPLLAVVGLGFSVYTVRSQNQERPAAAPVSAPAVSPFVDSIAGSGIIEASTRNIAIGTNIAGIVTKVMVKEGDPIKAGDVLFEVDDRTLRAELAVRQAALAAAKRTADRLAALPRPEDVPAAEAKVAEAEAGLTDMKNRYELMKGVSDKRAVSQDDSQQRELAVAIAQAKLAQAKADLAELKAGAWDADKAIAQAQVAQAAAQVAATQTEIDRLSVRAPVDGEVLECNIRVGEFAQTGPLATPLMLVGDTRTLYARIDIDENDAWRLKPGAKARVTLRGNGDIGTDVAFVRVEPYVIPKKSLTGDSSERVDTRVLQVLYSFPREALNAYVGQQVDARIDAPPGATATNAAAAKRTEAAGR